MKQVKKQRILFQNTISLSKLFIDGKANMVGWRLTMPKKLRQLEEENKRLEELVADLTLDNKVLNDIVSKN